MYGKWSFNVCVYDTSKFRRKLSPREKKDSISLQIRITLKAVVSYIISVIHDAKLHFGAVHKFVRRILENRDRSKLPVTKCVQRGTLEVNEN